MITLTSCVFPSTSQQKGVELSLVVRTAPRKTKRSQKKEKLPPLQNL